MLVGMPNAKPEASVHQIGVLIAYASRSAVAWTCASHSHWHLQFDARGRSSINGQVTVDGYSLHLTASGAD